MQQLLVYIIIALVSFQCGVLISTRTTTTASDLCHCEDASFSPILKSLNGFSSFSTNSNKKKHTSTLSSTSIPSSSPEPSRYQQKVDGFFHGETWIPRDQFVKKLDLGIPLKRENENVFLMYLSEQSLPKNLEGDVPSSTQPTDTSRVLVDDAIQNCDEVAVVVTNFDLRNKCLAVMRNWGMSGHLHRFIKSKEDGKMKYVTRFYNTHNRAKLWQEGGIKSGIVQNSLAQLSNYLTHYNNVLDELRPIAKKVAGGKGRGIVVMVSNFGQSRLLINFVCSARKIGMDLSQVLLFATDVKTRELAIELGLETYYNENIFGSIPEMSGQFADAAFGKVMMAKAYSVHLVNELGYDILFQDVDVVPLRPNVLDYFQQQQKEDGIDDFDMYFQYDHNPNENQAPYSANSGFYYVKYNQRTNYFLSMLVRMGDLIEKTQSHQQVMTQLLSEHMSSQRLRTKVMGGEEGNLFPSK